MESVSVREKLKALLIGGRDLIFPLLCVGCGEEKTLWCDVCIKKWSPRLLQHCPDCETATVYGVLCAKHRKHEPRALDGVVAAAWYANPDVQTLIKQWKYKYVRAVEPVLEMLINEWVQKSHPFPSGEWAVIPVPLASHRLRERGFDQAEELAKILVRAEPNIGRFRPEIIIRKRHFLTPQAEVNDLEERKARDFSKVFEAVKPAPPDIILVDDVYTTGSTMKAAATVLRDAGAKRIWGFALLRGH